MTRPASGAAEQHAPALAAPRATGSARQAGASSRPGGGFRMMPRLVADAGQDREFREGTRQVVTPTAVVAAAAAGPATICALGWACAARWSAATAAVRTHPGGRLPRVPTGGRSALAAPLLMGRAGAPPGPTSARAPRPARGRLRARAPLPDPGPRCATGTLMSYGTARASDAVLVAGPVSAAVVVAARVTAAPAAGTAVVAAGPAARIREVAETGSRTGCSMAAGGGTGPGRRRSR